MMHRTHTSRNIYDPMFARAVKKAERKYKDSCGSNLRDAISGEAHVDITDKGPAWYMGHMNVAKRELEKRMKGVDFVLEVRDARLPMSTANPDIDELIKTKPRLIVFNKADLANEQCNRLLQIYYEERGSHVLFTNARLAWRQTVETVIRFVQVCVPPMQFKTAPHLGLIVGMPNVGKSTLINALRIAHEYQFMRNDFQKPRSPQQVSMEPGTTRHVTTVSISRDPPITLCDTPGLTLAGNFSLQGGRKLALLGIIPPSASSMPIATLAQHVYDVMVQSGMTSHLAECLRIERPPVSFEDCIALLGERSGRSAMSQLNLLQQNTSHHLLVNDFSEGRLGRFTLDKLPKNVAAVRLSPPPPASEERTTSWKDTEVVTEDVGGPDEGPNSPESMKEVLKKIRGGAETISRKRGSVKEERMHYKLRDRI